MFEMIFLEKYIASSLLKQYITVYTCGLSNLAYNKYIDVMEMPRAISVLLWYPVC